LTLILLRCSFGKKPPFNVKDPACLGRLAKWLFTQRNKKTRHLPLNRLVRNELKLTKQQAQQYVASLPNMDWRARDLHPHEFGALADAITK
jgi:16S rRNA A1518/A1519 N6-dimethyltransferase RsmA/KsgA/DIM1 with predicted DNA glycosylase/AP lyase activity